jgi:hypothetical protein
MIALKHILHFLQGTLEFGLLLRRSSTSKIVVYSDVDWVGCPNTHQSTSGYAIFLSDNLTSWSSKCQNTVSPSSAEAEYQVVANGVVETCWLCQLLMELHSPLTHSTLVYCDNVCVVYLVSNCDRTTSEMRGLSPKIILGDSRRSDNAQTHTNKHTRLNMKFKLKLLQIKCYVLGSYNRQSPKCASKDNQSFCGSVYLSR